MRLILLFLAIWIALYLARGALARRRSRQDDENDATPTRTVRCARCGVHVPEGIALQHADGKTYCSVEHARGDG